MKWSFNVFFWGSKVYKPLKHYFHCIFFISFLNLPVTAQQIEANEILRYNLCINEYQNIKNLKYLSTKKAEFYTDSLIKLYEKNGNTKCWSEAIMAKASILDFENNTQESIQLLSNALRLNLCKNAVFEKATLTIHLANYFIKLNQLDSAFVHLSQAQQLLFEKKCCETGKLNLMFSKYYNDVYNYPKALHFALKAKDIMTECNDDASLAEIYNQLSQIYRRQYEYDKALYFQNIGLQKCINDNDKSCIAKAYYNLSVTYFKKKERTKAIDFAKKALSLNLEINDKIKAVELLILLADIDFDNKTNIQNASSALSIASQYNLITEKVRAQIILANLYIDANDKDLLANRIDPLQRWNKADSLFSNILANSYPALFFRSEAWLGLSKIYTEKKEWKSAYNSYKNYIILRDSLMNDQTQQKMNRMEIEYEFSKKTDSLNLKNILTKTALEKQSLIAQKNEQQYIIAENERRIQHLAFLQTQAELQTELAIKNEKNKQLKLTANELKLKKNQLKSSQQEVELSNLRVQQIQLLGILLSMIIAAIVIAVFYYKNNREKEELKKLRKQISQNLHDEIGANMSKIKLLSSMSKLSIKNEQKLLHYVQQIFDSSHQIGYSINDVIWSLNEDKMDHELILSRIRRYISEMYEANTIDYTIQFDKFENINKKQVLKLRQIYFIIKEAVNNTCKYSKAKNASVQIKHQKNKLITIISDNGIGFEPEKIKGNGLNNIISRSNEIEANCQIETSLNNGTTISIITPF